MTDEEAVTYPLDVIEPLKEKAFEAGLWNMFMPELGDDDPGTRMTNLEYAPLAVEVERVLWAPEAFNCSAPDTGNMEILKRFATPEQKERRLEPLMMGEMSSVVGLTEPDTASLDLINLPTAILKDREDYVINGRKRYSTGATHPNAKLAIVFGVSERVVHQLGMPHCCLMPRVAQKLAESFQRHSARDQDRCKRVAQVMNPKAVRVCLFLRQAQGRSNPACASRLNWARGNCQSHIPPSPSA
ncbi:acyl-CoA dehydrogenase family protein [Sinisalibacter aestuarii]